MDFSKVFDEIGDFGPYQCVVCISLAMSMIPASFSNLNTVFIMGVTEYWCAVPELAHLNSSDSDIREATIPSDGEGSYEHCSVYVRNYSTWDESDVEYYKGGNHDNATTEYCQDGWVFDTEVYGDTATTDWELVCDMLWWQAAAASAYALGMFVALLVYGTVADMFGRKPVLCGSTVLFIISNYTTAFSPSHQFLIATRFLCGFFSSPFYGGTFVLVVELIGPRWRPHVNAWYGYFWSFGGLLMTGLAFIVRDWRYLQLALSTAMLFYLVYIWLPESPRWLYSKDKKKEADAVFERIAISNKKIFHPEKHHFTTKSMDENGTGYVWQMFSGKAMAVKSVAMCFNWFAASICYYGLTFNSTSLGKNPYASFSISLLVEVPAVIIGHFVTVYVGRRMPLLISMITGGLILLATPVFETESIGLVISSNLGKIACTLSFNLLYVYVVEVYPTVIRSVASSAGNFSARLGSILAPFIAQLSYFGTYIPLVIFGSCSLVAGVLVILLPETIDSELKDTFETIEICDEVKNGSAEDNNRHKNDICTKL